MTVTVQAPFADAFTAALGGAHCEVVHPDLDVARLPVERWIREADDSDRRLLAHCVGTTLDVGCGPGRMAASLVAGGRPALGIDVVPAAVASARSRGVPALLRDVFAPLPGEGRWDTVLLADGNIGIGGDPALLLRRLHALLGPRGRVVTDLAPHGHGVRTRMLSLRTTLHVSAPFAWSVVGADAALRLAEQAGFAATALHEHAGRCFGVLSKHTGIAVERGADR